MCCFWNANPRTHHTYTSPPLLAPTPPHRVACYAANALNFLFVYHFLWQCRAFAFDTLGLSGLQTCGYATAATFGITIGLFVHFTYVVDALDRMRMRGEEAKRD